MASVCSRFSRAMSIIAFPILPARMRFPPENTIHSAVRPTVVRLRGASGKARVWLPIWSRILLINWSSGTRLWTKSLAGSVNCDNGCFTSIFSDRCTNVPAPCRLGYQRAFSLSRSVRAVSIPLSAIFRLRFPCCICRRASSKLRERICAVAETLAPKKMMSKICFIY